MRQAKVRDALKLYGLSADERSRFIDAVSELGELGKEMLKATDYGAEPICATPAIMDEMGDCLFALISLCETLEIDAFEALDAALDKYAARFNLKRSVGSTK